MACSCVKRRIAKQEVKKNPPKTSVQPKNHSGARIIHRVIR